MHRTSVYTFLKVDWMAQEAEKGQGDDRVTISKTGPVRLAQCSTIARDGKAGENSCVIPWSPTFRNNNEKS